MPLNIGATWTPEGVALIPKPTPKQLGVFARLVAKQVPGEPTEEPELIQRANLKSSSSRINKNKRFPIPPPSEPLQNYDSRFLQEEDNQLRSLNVNPSERMTMSDFEERMKSIDLNIDIDPEDKKQIKHLLNQRKATQSPNPSQAVEAELMSPTDRQPTTQEYVEYGRIIKFKRTQEMLDNKNEKVEVTVDRGRAYIFDPEVGYQVLIQFLPNFKWS
jgi:hypothetical protein